MAQAGDEITVHGVRLRFLKTTEDTRGAFLLLEARWPPRSRRPLVHDHPRQLETYHVLKGELRVMLDNRNHALHVGDEAIITTRTPHTIWNEGKEEAIARWEIRPAMRTEQYLEAMAALERAGRLEDRGLPETLQWAVLAREFRREIRMLRPSPLLQPVWFTVLASIGRIAGRAPSSRLVSGPHEGA